MNKRRVVISGMGLVSPLGHSPEAFWANLLAGKSGIGPITRFDVSPYYARIAGEIRDFDPEDYIERKDARRMDPFTHFGLAAARMAMMDSRLDLDAIDRERIGVLVGSGIGGLHVMQEQGRNFEREGPKKFSPFMIPQMITDILSGYIAIEYGLQGPNFSISSACATAAHSMGESMRMIQYGDADIMVAGGAESALNDLGIGGFDKMRALSRKRNDDPEAASRPFDAERDGFVMAEGAGVLVLEEMGHAKARGARIYCELAGYGRTCDAYHITAPHETGRGAARAMSLAMEDAGLQPEQVQYINAHGTSTPLNDRGETMAIKTAFGEEQAYKLAISSTKSMTGHALGAAAAFESVACALTLRDQIVPPTINYEHPDPDCDLDIVPNQKREMTVEACLNNSLGFGGHNACLCFRKI
ncbi:MAG: 3-oxoacyl-[acyl-carrier-protein] synthase II [Kiritimatiellia bacterium]